MEKRGDAPKIVNVAVWTTAVAGAFVFALTVGIGLYNTVNAPISASEAVAPAAAPVAPACNNVSINNYPVAYFNDAGVKAGNKHAPFESQMGGNWRCSTYCVTGFDKTKAVNSAENIAKVQAFFNGATIDGQPINMVTDESVFTNLKDGVIMARTVILPDLKATCQGALYGGTTTAGASDPYKNLKLKDQTTVAKESVPNNTVQEQQAKVETQKQADEAAKAKTAAELQDASEAGRTGSGQVVTRGTSGNGSGSKPKAKVRSTGRAVAKAAARVGVGGNPVVSAAQLAEQFSPVVKWANDRARQARAVAAAEKTRLRNQCDFIRASRGNAAARIVGCDLIAPR